MPTRFKEFRSNTLFFNALGMKPIQSEDGEILQYDDKDGYIAKIIFDKLNAKASYIQPVQATADTNPDEYFKYGVIGDVYTKRAMFAFNAQFLDADMYYIFEPTYPFETEYLRLLVPKADIMPIDLYLLKTFGMFFVFMHVTMFQFYYALIIFFLYVEYKILGNWDTFNQLLLYATSVAFSASLANSTNFPFKLISVRFIFFILMLESFFLTNLIGSLLITAAATKNYFEDLNTVQEVYRSNLTVNVQPFDIALIYKNFKPEYESFDKYYNFIRNLEQLDNVDFTLSLMFNTKDAYVLRQDYAELYIKSPLNYKNGHPKFHLVEEHFILTFLTYKGQ